MSGSVIKTAISNINFDFIASSKNQLGSARDDKQGTIDRDIFRFRLEPRFDSQNQALSIDETAFFAKVESDGSWGNFAQKAATFTSTSIKLDNPDDPLNPSSSNKNKNSGDPLDAIANALGIKPGDINPDFIAELNSLGGSNGVGFSAGSTNTEKSFNPLTEITTLKNGLTVHSLNSFFKVSDIKDPELNKYANKLLAQDQWGAYSRAFDDLFTHALKNEGLDPKKDKAGMSSRISTYIAQTAKLINDAIDSSGKPIKDENRALAASFVATHFSIDKIAEQLGFTAETIAKQKEGDQHFLLSEALLANPKLLDDPTKKEILQKHLTESISENYDAKLSQFAQSYKGEGNSLSKIEPEMYKLLQGKYKDDIAKLNGGQMPTQKEISDFMSKNGYSAGGAEYHKIDNAEIAAQTYMNLKAIQHDHELFKQGKLTDENRMYKAAQTIFRSTPTAQHDGSAFNENNGGRKMTALAGNNRDLVGNIALPFVSKEQMSTLLTQMKDLGIELSAVDISHHGCQTGTSGFGVQDKNGLLQQIVERMSDGGEILYNSCLTGSGTESGANNLALTTLLTAAKDKGLKVHAADQSTIGYHEDTVYDAFSGLISTTPRKLDGVVGGYTIQEGGIEEVQDKTNLAEERKKSYVSAS